MVERSDLGELEMKRRIILDLCGGTGAWSQPYRDAGYDVRLVTLPQDVRTYTPPYDVHGILAAPPCTEFAVSGARWWAKKDPHLLEEALEVFDACFGIILGTDPAWWALENPVGRLKQLRPDLGEPALIFDPCDYGDAYTKKTLVWGNFNSPPKRRIEPEAKNRIHHCPPGPERQKLRSQTPPGFAYAFFCANP